jgi:hypothetical protein
MGFKPDELFDKITIKKIYSKITLTDLQIQSAKEWISMLEKNQLKKEKESQHYFETIILQEILGYDGRDCKREKEFIDYTIEQSGSSKSLCIEVKGTKTIDLFAYQNYNTKDKENPILQTWTYMGNGYDYGICTNYNNFVILSKDVGTKKVYKFNFLSMKLTEDRIDEDKLKEFIAFFSKKEIFTNNSIDNAINNSKLAEQEFTDEFYKLFHETRLMLIKEFEQSSDVSRETAIHWAQIFLNRLIFIYFVEDHNFIPDRLFVKRIHGILESPSVDESTQKIYDDILGLFRIMNKGSDVLRVNGFNGGLFGIEIPSNVSFPDLRTYDFFNECYQNSKLSLKSVTVDISTSGIYGDHLSPLIKNLLIMDSYDFTSDLNVNILGHIFEQSISDIESLHENEISKRKKHGVFYTPDYITDYICRNSIIPYLSKTGKNSVIELVDEYSNNLEELEEKIKNLKILDPACGSGAFLVKAVDMLLEIDEEVQFRKPTKQISQKGMDEFTKIKEINLIIENNIYGVDLNPESVEITKLSLFLKLAGPQSKLGNLSNNIKTGNSLINDKKIEEKSFSWEHEFPEILSPLVKAKGFDIIIGNPPYVRQELFKEIKQYLKSNYESFNSLADMYVYFVEKATHLLKPDGILSFIIPNKFLKTGYGKQIRVFLKNNITLLKLYNFDDYPVFADAITYTMILVFQKTKKDNYKFVTSELNETSNALINLKKNEYLVSSTTLTEEPWDLSNSKTLKILQKMQENSVTLDKFILKRIFYGIKTGRNNIFVIDKKLRDELVKDHKSEEVIKKVVTGTEVKRYNIDFDDKYILFLPWDYDLEFSPKIKEYLLNYKTELEKRSEVKTGRYNWWVLTRYGSENVPFLSLPKIIYPRITNNSNFCLDESGEIFITDNNFYISSSSKSLLAILNSKLIFYYLMQKCPSLQGGFFDFRREYIQKIPISTNQNEFDSILEEKSNKILNYNRSLQDTKNKIQNRIILEFNPKKINKKLKDIQNLEFNEFIKEIKKVSSIHLSLEKLDEWEDYFTEKKNKLHDLQNRINSIDNEINKIVYEIYSISPDEIKTIDNKIK